MHRRGAFFFPCFDFGARQYKDAPLKVKGFGRQKGHAELYRGAEYSVNFLPKVKIDVAIADDQLEEVIDIISKAAYTGKIGDGKIFVAELMRVIRIRTGEADEAAL